jgi:hypothetical protein
VQADFTISIAVPDRAAAEALAKPTITELRDYFVSPLMQTDLQRLSSLFNGGRVDTASIISPGTSYIANVGRVRASRTSP